MKIKIIVSILIARIFFCQFVFAQINCGAANIKVKKTNGKTEEIKLYEASYTLVIG